MTQGPPSSAFLSPSQSQLRSPNRNSPTLNVSNDPLWRKATLWSTVMNLDAESPFLNPA